MLWPFDRTVSVVLYIYSSFVCMTSFLLPDLRIRLNASSVAHAGRVEVLLAGKWGAIDRYTWQLNDAHVACRQLGFTSGAELAVRGATFIFNAKWTATAMKIQWIENVQCIGNESLLRECPHDVSFTPGPLLEAGVICTTQNAGKITERTI